MTDYYAIWKQDGNQRPVLMKMNMTITQATEYITYQRENLPQGERFFTENQDTSKVDMFFTTDSVITPDKPMFVKNGKLAKIPPKSGDRNKPKRTSNELKPRNKSRTKQDEQQMRFEQYIRQGMTVKQAERQLRNDEFYFQRIGKKSKPTKSRGKWIGNMFKSSNKRLQNITRTGTPKQKTLARKILKNRRK